MDGARIARVAVLAIALLASSCTGEGSDATGGDRPVVIATTSILGDVVSTIVGEDATVEVLMPPGADPHDVEPSARQAARLRTASMVVANGLGLEARFASAIDSAEDEGVAVIRLAEQIEALPSSGHDHEGEDEAAEADHEDEEDDGALDPHFWHDPSRMADSVGYLVESLVAAEPSFDASALRQRAEALVADLEALDAEIASILDAVPDDRRFLLTHHATFGYLADRYDFEVVGSVIPGGDTLARSSAADLEELVREIEEHDLPAIFTDNTVSAALSETLAAETELDVEVVALHTDSLGEPGSGAETYVGMLRSNAERIAEALA